MTRAIKRFIAATCVVFAVGCITDELAVYQDGIVSPEAGKRFFGDYEVKVWPGDDRPKRISVNQAGEQFQFSYSLAEKEVRARFILSKIPNSKQDLYLLSIPAQAATNQANLFFVGRAEEDQTSIWVVVANLPVAKEHLRFQDGKAKASDVKAFLAAHADAFVAANEAQVQLRHSK